MAANSTTTTASGFRVRSPSDYFPLLLVAGICLALLGIAVIASVLLCVDVAYMRAELEHDISEFAADTDRAWDTLVHLKPPQAPWPFIQGIRVRRQYDQSSGTSGYGGSADSNADHNQNCQCGKISTHCPKGPPGPKGPSGDPGEPGTPGRPGNVGAQGEEMVFEAVTPPCIQCPMGAPGVPGTPGRPGRPGANGVDGEDGRDGRDGDDGAPGCVGPPGVKGAPGKIGERGVPGENGFYGVGRPGPKGPRGPRGIQGIPGEPGSDGVAGPDGLPGPAGPRGSRGERGEPGIVGVPGNAGKDAEDATYCPCPERFTQNADSPKHVNPIVQISSYKNRRIVASAVVKAKAAA